MSEQRGPWMIYPPGHGPGANWIVSTAISGDYFERWKDGFAALWFDYAKRHDLGIAVAVEDLYGVGEPRLNGSWQKLLAVNALS